MGIPKFESPLPHNRTRSGGGFHFIENYCAKNAPMAGLQFKGLKLVNSGKRWYVEFYYRKPEGLERPGEWVRIRKYENINRIKDKQEKEKHAELLLTSIKYAMANGDYNPLEEEEKLFVKKEGPALTAEVAIKFFEETINEKSLDAETQYRYTMVAKRFLEYLKLKGKQGIPFESVDEMLVTQSLQHYRGQLSWSNRHYNNNLGFLSIVFNFLKRRKKITHNPCDNIEKLKSVSHKHRYYDAETLKKVLDLLKKQQPHLYIIAQFIYYAGVRSSKEIVNFQVGDILLDRERIRFRGAATKGKREDYILLDPHLKALILEEKLTEYPAEYFVFTHTGKPGAKPSAPDFMQKRFRKVRKDLNLSEDYTLYSLKHTRAVHLLTDGAQPIDIMQLFRHHDLTTTTKYIRDLGFDLNAKFTEKSRKL